MYAAGIDVQVLSLTFPGVEQLEAPEAVAFARETNDLLAEAVRRHPGRFAGFAALATAAPEAAAEELERTALLPSASRGRWFSSFAFGLLGALWPSPRRRYPAFTSLRTARVLARA